MKRLLSIPVVTAVCLLAGCLCAPGLAAEQGAAGQVAADQAGAPAGEGFQPDSSMERTQIPERYKWDLDHLFPSEAAWNEAIEKVRDGAGLLHNFEGRLDKPKLLFACLSMYFNLQVLANRVTLTANLEHTEDLVSPRTQANLDKGLAVMNELMDAARFIRSEIMTLDEQVLKEAFRKDPRLEPFRTYIEGFRRRSGLMLPSEGERILSLAGDNLFAEIDLNEIPSSVEKAFIGLMSDIPWPKIVDEQGKKVQLSLANYGRYRGSPDREVRCAAVQAFFGTLKQFQHALAATLGGQVSFNSFLAQSRGFDRAIEAYMDKDNIDVAVYDNLVSAINANLAPLHRYMALRKKVMQVDELRLYDLYVPMVAGVERKVAYEDGTAMIQKALAPLGPEYLKILAIGMDPANGWADVYPCANKESGAFSASVHGCHPFVKLNYFNSLDDVSTVAHEFGHALHSLLSARHQPPSSYRYVSFIAEIASTFNETLLARHLIANASSDEEKLYLLNGLADTIRTTIYRQTLFAEFEKTIHDLYESGVTLTAERLNQTYADLVRRYYGEAYTVGPDDDIEWAYIPHFYWKFYVYTYATGLSAGISLANKVLEGGPEARAKYLTMLEGGCSRPPLELLRRAGLDLTKPEAIAQAAKLLDETLSQMEAILLKK